MEHNHFDIDRRMTAQLPIGKIFKTTNIPLLSVLLSIGVLLCF